MVRSIFLMSLEVSEQSCKRQTSTHFKLIVSTTLHGPGKPKKLPVNPEETMVP